MRVVVLGAAGQAGRRICGLLLDDAAIEVVACGRDESRLHSLESSLSTRAGSLTTAAFDLRDDPRLDAVLEPAVLVIGATSRWRDGPHIARRALRFGTSYLGIYLSNAEKWSALRSLQDECLANDLAIVDDGGLHPGLPGAMIRFMAEKFSLTSAWVAAKFDVKWSALGLARETVLDFVAEFETTDPSFYLDGEWVRGYRHFRRFDFGEGIGSVSCMPMLLEEIREVATTIPSLRSAGFFIAGFGAWMDYVILPLGMGLGKLHRAAGSRLVWWGLRRFEASSDFGLLMLQGTTDEERSVGLRVFHPDPYWLTAVPVAATAQQMLSAPKPGVWTQAAFVEPRLFFESLERMGLKVESYDH